MVIPLLSCCSITRGRKALLRGVLNAVMGLANPLQTLAKPNTRVPCESKDDGWYRSDSVENDLKSFETHIKT